MLQIQYELTTVTVTNLGLYNANGQLVKTLVAPASQAIGIHQLSVDIGDLPSGLYFSVFRTSEKSEVEKIVLVR